MIAAAGGPEAVAEVAAEAAAKDPDAAPAKARGAGPIVLAATVDGTLLYVQNMLAGTVEGFRIGPNGELTLVESENEGLPAFTDGSGMEGLVVW
ncbi:hypothetical protein [Winogradskya humida]|uniref:Lactonase family protein with 7-bladed beta-propeller n=1 Tax=Winogradskya humida TaxID=113566 RepID=A0ABQ4A0S6_9ACTN|nr:hypothetical protein [Actinoplanes humidus]GIE24464.1 hypothetical protein Ahu01nite_075660 [Actinoplanes humidus]